MKRNKVVYVVMGSEDGILGVYGNKKGAYKEALNYINQGPVKNLKVLSYLQVCKELKDRTDYWVELREYTMGINATIHALLFNKNQEDK